MGFSKLWLSARQKAAFVLLPTAQKLKRLQDVRVVQIEADLRHGICLPLSGATGFVLTYRRRKKNPVPQLRPTSVLLNHLLFNLALVRKEGVILCSAYGGQCFGNVAGIFLKNTFAHLVCQSAGDESEIPAAQELQLNS